MISVNMSLLQLNDIESVTSVAIIDKTLGGFNLCCHKNSLSSTIILHPM